MSKSFPSKQLQLITTITELPASTFMLLSLRMIETFKDKLENIINYLAGQ